MGDKYKAIRSIAEEYGVSIQSAQKAMQVLKEDNIVELKPKAGATILNLEPSRRVRGMRIGVFSNLIDPVYDTAFFSAIEEKMREQDIAAELFHVEENLFSGLELAYHVLQKNVDGAIFLSYTRSALSLYHLYREGFPFVSDIRYAELPMIPTVQTNNFIHAFEAGQRQHQAGYNSFVMIGYQTRRESIRYRGYTDGIGGNESQINYIQLSDAQGIARLSHSIHYLESQTAVFCADYPLIDMVASKFLQHNVPVSNDRLLVYDCVENEYHFQGLPAIKSVAPGIQTIATKLCDVLVKIMKTGDQPSPSQVLI